MVMNACMQSSSGLFCSVQKFAAKSSGEILWARVIISCRATASSLISPRMRKKIMNCGTKPSAVGNKTESDAGNWPFDWRSENMWNGANITGLLKNLRRDKLLLSGQANIIKRCTFVSWLIITWPMLIPLKNTTLYSRGTPGNQTVLFTSIIDGGRLAGEAPQAVVVEGLFYK